ncbi:hypothetical protein TI39_contig298g00047 [Zymoseptoria brevis]|uniref:Uncharacterized protein n=1 Tax=Zymoseptoria brevis TaxID=1047168 RepID=A0A0F4GVL2_9PEZI|nr:hypothetical protein TI39_contig298g00047 [Zymoseptoria brevis]
MRAFFIPLANAKSLVDLRHASLNDRVPSPLSYRHRVHERVVPLQHQVNVGAASSYRPLPIQQQSSASSREPNGRAMVANANVRPPHRDTRAASGATRPVPTDLHEPTAASHRHQSSHTINPFQVWPRDAQPSLVYAYLPISTPEMPIVDPAVTAVEDACRIAVKAPAT